ncbi:MAG: acetyl-CoA hydrolase [Gammaproteobacteria bacterium]|nr:acetyl-CoA hydrolase [Gammaproteobacteria bacterium]
MFRNNGDKDSVKTAQNIANDIIQRMGKTIVLGLPLGAGKAINIANALTQIALEDSSIKLTIFTALTLVKPTPKSELAKRFLTPISDRLFGQAPELLYAKKIQQKNLPDNIEVNEFFLMSGQWIGNEHVQQNYIPANYTHAMSVLLSKGMNVLAQSISEDDGNYSLSCNPDITVDLLKARQQGKADFIFATEVNPGLPYMFGEAEIDAKEIDYLLNAEQVNPSDLKHTVFSVPKTPLCDADHAIGLHASRLVKDGGTLQIGIGAIGDAICHALTLRQNNNQVYNSVISELSYEQAEIETIPPFTEGLYALSEMFVDGFITLYESGVLKRKVNDALLHGGFFLGNQSFYQKLKSMPKDLRRLFQMMPVSFTNKLEGDIQTKIKQRRDARFINSAMMVTLRGAIVSDGLENGQVISGVGGQFDFVSQSFSLPGARSIITLNSTRKTKGKVVSNIVWSYGHQTVPWHMRDIIITEYGIADLRGKTESEAIKSMLNITDSRFQNNLIKQAKDSGKIEQSYQLPKLSQRNTPEFIAKQLQSTQHSESDGLLFPAFPISNDFTEVEERLISALEEIEDVSHSKVALIKMLSSGLLKKPKTTQEQDCLKRMQLLQVKSFKEHVYRALILEGLNR